MLGKRKIKKTFFCFVFVVFYCGVASEISTVRKHMNGSGSVQGVIGRKVKIPCKPLNDNVKIVFWTKVETNTDIYNLDARNEPLVKAHHGYISDRYNFMPLERPSYLLINDLTLEDEGTYSCSIRFKSQVSQTVRTYLEIIVPPVSIKIFDSKLKELQTKSNELEENSTAEFTCQVTGGRPAPIITWFKGAELLDNEVDDDGTQVLRNRLQYGPLTREDDGTDLVCQASNSDLTSPLNKKITLDVNYAPLSVEITTQDTPLIADSEFTIVCRSHQAKPAAIITWLLDDKVLNTTKDYVVDDKAHNTTKDYTKNNGKTTESQLKFTPTVLDGGKTLTCKAESPVLLTKPLTVKRVLDIYYDPSAKLSIEPEGEVVEGDKVTFKCEVNSNPVASNITWYHKGRRIEENEGKNIRMENDVMLLSSVTRKMSGVYTCLAANQVGFGKSNAVILHIKYVPVCSESENQIVGASLKEEIKVLCSLKAYPNISSFRWQYSSPLETFNILDNFTSEDKRSILRYKPMKTQDFGTLKCWGTNEQGEQVDPCVFLVVEAGFPEKPENCTFLGNYTSSSVFVRCYEGHDGGLPQNFFAEVYDMKKKVVMRNVTSREPLFAISNLPPGTDFLLTIYSANSKGPSEKQVLQVYTAAPTEKRLFSVHSTHEFPITPILGVLIGIVGALVIVAIIIMVITKLRSGPSDKKNPKDDANGVRAPLHPRDGGESGLESANERTDSPFSEDGLPNKLKHANLYETVAYETSDGLKQSGEILSNKSSEKDSADDVEYAELNFSNIKDKNKSKKSKSKKKSSKSNGNIHSSYDPTLYVSICHVQTEKKKLQQQQLEKQQQQQQLQQQIPPQEQLLNMNNDTNGPNSSPLSSNLNEKPVAKFESFPQPPSLPPISDTVDSPKGIHFVDCHKEPSAPPLQSILRHPEKRQAPLSPDVTNQPMKSNQATSNLGLTKTQETASKKPPTSKPTNLDKPPIAKKPTFVQDLAKKNKKSAETQTENDDDDDETRVQHPIRDEPKDDIPLMDSTIERHAILKWHFV